MTAVAAGGVGLVVYLLVALAGSDGPAATSPDEARAVVGSGERQRPELAPRRGRGPETLKGSVIDAAGAPVAELYVTAEEESGAAAVVGKTDGEGGFALEGVATGRHRLRVEGQGILTAEVGAVDAPGDPVRIVVAREVAVDGRVRRLDGRPGPGVDVRLVPRGGGGALAARSGPDGRFYFTGLAEGRYRIWAFRGEQVSAAPEVDRVGAGPFEPVDLVLTPGALLRGQVINEVTGRGVIADVTLVADDPDQPPRQARTDGGGGFSVEGLPFGRWTADAAAPGYLSADAIRFLAASEYAAVIHLQPGAAISGRVIDADGRPLEGAAVSARGEGPDGGTYEVSEAAMLAASTGESAPAIGWRGGATTATGLKFIPRGELGVVIGPLPYPPPPGAGSFRVASPLATSVTEIDPLPVDPAVAPRFTTDSDGRFRLTGVAPGRYHLRARRAGFADGSSETFPVEIGRDVEAIDVVLGAGLTLHGQVVDDGGAAVVGATISATGGDPRSAVTGPGGRYQLGPLAGEVRVTVAAGGYGSASREVSAPRVARQPLRRQEDFILPRANAEIEGRLTDPTGFAVRGARLSSGAASATTDAAGRFRITGVPGGRHPVRIEHADYPTIEVEARTGVDNRLALPFGGGVEVAVRDRSTRAALAGARLSARLGDRRHAASTGPDGRAALAPLAAGRWTVEAIAPGYAATAVTVEVSEARRLGDITARGVELELTRVATVAGVVRDVRGERVAGAEVSIDGALSRTTTDGQGRFRLIDAPSGPINIRAGKGGKRGSLAVDLRPGDEAVTLELRLK